MMTSNARKHQFMKLFVAIIGLPNVSEAVLGLKTRSPITVILEGLLSPVASRVVPTLAKRADQREKDRCNQYSGRRTQKQADADGQAGSQPCRHRRLKEWEGVTNVSFRVSPRIDLNLVVLYLNEQQSYRRYNLTKWYLQIELCS